jgi:hypothetical protein
MRVYQFSLTGRGALFVGLVKWSKDMLCADDPDYQPTGRSIVLAPGEHLDPGGQIRRADDSIRQEEEP